MDTLTFEQLPKAVSQLIGEVGEIKNLLLSQEDPKKDEAMGLDRVVEIDPLHRKKSTFYGYTQNPDSGFPFRKRGKLIVVLRSEFEEWLKIGKQKTVKDIQDQVDQELTK